MVDRIDIYWPIDTTKLEEPEIPNYYQIRKKISPELFIHKDVR